MCKTDDIQASFTDFENEVTLLSSLMHPYIIKFYGATVQSPNIGIIMEYCENGNLKKFLKSYNKENNDIIPFLFKLYIINKISNGMMFLHSKDVIHRDLKPQNI
ncbi:unnamed protein product, partial [marine sediment metagenome]